MAASSPASPTQTAWADLLFSPRPAWLWDADAGAFIWANSSARMRFGGDLAAMKERLPRQTARRLSAVAQFKRRPLVAKENLLIDKSAAGGDLVCDLEGLRLADGHAGLIVKEAVEPAPRRAGGKRGSGSAKTAPAPKLVAGRRVAPKKPSRKSQPTRSPQVAHGAAGHRPTLSPEELASFRAIGRRVRRLCREKQRAASAPRPESSAVALHSAKPDTTARRESFQPHVLPFDANVLQAFDAFMLVDHRRSVQSLTGRLCRTAGWTKRECCSRDVTLLACEGERARFEALFEKLAHAGRRTVADELVFEDRQGAMLPCRVILGRAGESAAGQNGPFAWVAVISLKMKDRLSRKVQPAGTFSQAERMAA